MKKALLFLLLLPAFALSAQDVAWKPIGLTLTGSNVALGVTAFYQVSQYDGKEVVFMKLVNHNDYKVKVEWNPAAFTNEHVWLVKDNDIDKRSVTIGADSTVAADCTGTAPSMVYKLDDFPIIETNLIRYGVKNFNVIKQ